MKAPVTTTLHYSVVHTGGSGAPLLTMHGLSFDHTYFRPWLDRLGSGRPIVYYDHRGNGRSNGHALNAKAMTLESFTADVDTLRRSLGFHRVTVLGHSGAAAIALSYARNYASHAAGLILCDPVLSVGHIASALDRVRPRCTPAQADAFDRAFAGTANDEEYGRLWRIVLPLYFHNHIAAMADRVFSRTIFRADALTYFVQNLAAGSDLEPVLASLDLPVLWLDGERDWLRRDDAAMVELRNCRYRLFAGSGHFPFVEEPEGFLGEISQWLNDQQR